MPDRLERLVNLVIALRETRLPLQAAEIRTRVAGYGQSDPEAFRRMFERDKADLRALGVPIETAALDRLGDDRIGYRIDPSAYDLPALDFRPDELVALAVAVDATGLGDAAAGGLRKLEVDVGEPGLTRSLTGPPGLDINLDAPQLGILSEAQVTRTAVRFRYRSAAGDAATRTVDPHALVHRRGRWYLVGRDHDRDAQRAFRLDRIEGSVRTIGQPGAFPAVGAPIDVDAVVPSPPPGAPETAQVEAAPDVAWQVARVARGAGEEVPDGWTRFEVPVGDPEAFLGWALGWGPDVTVVGPPELRDRVEAALRAAAGAAGDRPGGPA